MIKPSLKDLLNSSIRSVLKNKSRTILTSLGVIIGVTSVILLSSIGNGLKSFVAEQFETLGANSIFISPCKVFSETGGFNNIGGMSTTTFTQKDFTILKKEIKNTTIIPINFNFIDIKSTTATKKQAELNGSIEAMGQANNLLPSPGNGRWYTDEENAKKSSVIVLGHQVAKTLFPNSRAVGKNVIIKGKTLKVVGVVDQKGSSMGGPNIDEQAYAPFNLVADLSGNDNIISFMAKARDRDSVDQVKKNITKVMEERYDKDSFSVYDSSQLLKSINSIISVLTTALTGIAAISLVVGGIGIMNIMLVTVSERTRGIGLRKAIGAYPRAILIQFLFEAVILSGLGGIIGIILGSLGTAAINNFFPAKVTFNSILTAFGVSFMVGIVFGVIPARKASQLSPIEALRYE